MPAKRKKLPNIVFFGIDSLRADHMSCYGYPRLTTPHIDRIAQESTLFERYYSPHIPTTSGYANMLTGMDVFSTQVVALGHKGPMRPEVRTLAEILRDSGYTSTCVGFTGNPAARGFDKYIDYKSWGAWDERPLTKAQNVNEVVLPELDRLYHQKQPFLLFMRHLDPHTPYLPPAPFERMFYGGDETDPANHSMDECMAFKPFCDYFASWMPPGIKDKEYVIAQYDGETAYLDSCIRSIFAVLEARGVLDETLVVITSDHGETLHDHDCYYDHHGLYDQTLHVPLIIRYPGKLPAGRRVGGYTQHYDLVPTVLDLLDIPAEGNAFDGKSLLPMVRGEVASHSGEFYVTECTWMRKHGWRTPQWKLIEALEPDFHFKPALELYNLVEDPGEMHNLAEAEPQTAAYLKARMDAWIARREKETGLTNPIRTQGAWFNGKGPFKTSQEAYDTMHIGDPEQAARMQASQKKR